jgi:deoxyribonuclease-1-like protein
LNYRILRLALVFLLVLPFCIVIKGQENGNENISLCSWNIKDFGKTKSDAEINFIAEIVKDYDVVLIQEVVAKDPGGAQAVGRLGEALKRKGAKWEYRISDPTSGENSYKRERYAILWKTSKLTIVGKPWLEQKFHAEINREPFYITFASGSKQFTVVNFHAITKTMQPETEVKYLKFLPDQYPVLNLLFCGDFNLPESHTVFNPLKKMNYKPALLNQKTTIKKSGPGDDCLISAFDNVFYNSKKIKPVSAGVIHFYKSFDDLFQANAISDHLPIYFKFSLN